MFEVKLVLERYRREMQRVSEMQRVHLANSPIALHADFVQYFKAHERLREHAKDSGVETKTAFGALKKQVFNGEFGGGPDAGDDISDADAATNSALMAAQLEELSDDQVATLLAVAAKHGHLHVVERVLAALPTNRREKVASLEGKSYHSPLFHATAGRKAATRAQIVTAIIDAKVSHFAVKDVVTSRLLTIFLAAAG